MARQNNKTQSIWLYEGITGTKLHSQYSAWLSHSTSSEIIKITIIGNGADFQQAVNILLQNGYWIKNYSIPEYATIKIEYAQ